MANIELSRTTAYRDTKRTRTYPPRVVSPAVMLSPPTITWSKCQGLFSATIASGGSGYAVNDVVTLAGGTNSTPAQVTVTAVSGGAVTAVSVLRGGVYTANPANPISQASTTGGGTGLTLNGTFASYAASSIASKLAWSATTANLWRYNIVAPLTNRASSGYYGSGAYNDTHASIEFWSDAPVVEIGILAFNTKLMVFENGQPVQATDFATDSSGAGYILTLSHATSALRHYKIVGFNLNFSGVYTGAAYSVWPPTEPRRPAAIVLGDSYTFGNGADTTFTSWTFSMAEAAGLDVINSGVGGKGWNSTGADLPATRVTADVLLRTVAPDVVIFAWGYNDSAGSMVTLAANANDAIDAVQAGLPNAKIIVLGPWTPVGATTNLTTVKTTLQGIASAQGVVFIDIENWVNSANKAVLTGGDNVHPTQAGHDYLGGRIGQAIAAAVAA